MPSTDILPEKIQTRIEKCNKNAGIFGKMTILSLILLLVSLDGTAPSWMEGAGFAIRGAALVFLAVATYHFMALVRAYGKNKEKLFKKP